MNTVNFCTLFDFRYSSRGLALYKSIEKHCADFHLFVLAMDDAATALLTNLSLSNMTVITLAEFENAELSQAKSTRTRQEYCWTCTPAIIRFCLNKYELPECTYLDADILFFNNPRIILEQLPKQKTVLITPHHYAKEYDQSATSGIFCVQFVTFKNESRALKVLDTWYHQCIEWCYAHVEDGKFGDQKYLDSWPEEYDCVEVSEHFGAGVAPWNIRKYDLDVTDETILIKDFTTNKILPLIFYHFHDLYFNTTGSWYHKSGYPGYQIGEDVYHLVYGSYLRQLHAIGTELDFPIGVDFPRPPLNLSVSDFERIIIPRTKTFLVKEKLRSFYVFNGQEYEATSIMLNNEVQIFELLVTTHYNLSSVTLWEIPENSLYQSILQTQLRLNKIKNNIIIRLFFAIRNLYKSITRKLKP
ncbi:MAG: hypothetical protein LC101_06115 [Flavobacteriales bacterium]|nr:hypothetical protein [Flavobacteriales bacterium]